MGMITSTCPDVTCSYRNSFGYCSVSACINRPDVQTNVHSIISVVCELCKYDLEDGDYLYQRRSYDHGITFDEIVVHYCPVCGRKLAKGG